MNAKKPVTSYSTFLDFLNILRNVSDRDSVVTKLGAGQSGVFLPAEVRNLFLLLNISSTEGFPPPGGVKQPDRAADHLPPCKLKTSGSIPPWRTKGQI